MHIYIFFLHQTKITWFMIHHTGSWGYWVIQEHSELCSQICHITASHFTSHHCHMDPPIAGDLFPPGQLKCLFQQDVHWDSFVAYRITDSFFFMKISILYMVIMYISCVKDVKILTNQVENGKTL